MTERDFETDPVELDDLAIVLVAVMEELCETVWVVDGMSAMVEVWDNVHVVVSNVVADDDGTKEVVHVKVTDRDADFDMDEVLVALIDDDMVVASVGLTELVALCDMPLLLVRVIVELLLVSVDRVVDGVGGGVGDFSLGRVLVQVSVMDRFALNENVSEDDSDNITVELRL